LEESWRTNFIASKYITIVFEIDDVDLVAVAEDERRHLRVPVAGLVAEMHARFEHLAHRGRHG
jgi:hypothetical protein